MKFKSKSKGAPFANKKSAVIKPVKDDDQMAHSRINYNVDKIEEPEIPGKEDFVPMHQQVTEMPSFIEFVDMLTEINSAELKAFAAMVHSNSKKHQDAVNKAWMDARTKEATDKSGFSTAKKKALQSKVK